MNYQQLKAAIAGYAHRTDLEPMMATFVELATNRIGRDTILVELEKTATLTPADENTPAPLPVKFMRAISVTTPSANGAIAMEYYTPRQFAEIPNDAGQAWYYTIENNTLKVGPVSTAVANLLYLEKPDPLVQDADTNTILTNWLNLYLYGCLVEVWIYLQNPVALQAVLQVYGQEVKACNQQADAARHSGAPIVMRGA